MLQLHAYCGVPVSALVKEALHLDPAACVALDALITRAAEPCIAVHTGTLDYARGPDHTGSICGIELVPTQSFAPLDPHRVACAFTLGEAAL